MNQYPDFDQKLYDDLRRGKDDRDQVLAATQLSEADLAANNH